jgi:hypothetical protein
MRVKQVSGNRLFWSLGRGEGDTVMGVELFSDGKGHLRRTIFSRGKYGRESRIFEEEYAAEEFREILGAEEALLSSVDDGKNGDVRRLLLKAMERLRRAYDGL